MCRECGCPISSERHLHRHLHRHFLTNEERAKRLENYAEELRKEIAAVEEQIEELRSKEEDVFELLVSENFEYLFKLLKGPE